jgi:hypothetical protein
MPPGGIMEQLQMSEDGVPDGYDTPQPGSLGDTCPTVRCRKGHRPGQRTATFDLFPNHQGPVLRHLHCRRVGGWLLCLLILRLLVHFHDLRGIFAKAF